MLCGRVHLVVEPRGDGIAPEEERDDDTQGNEKEEEKGTCGVLGIRMHGNEDFHLPLFAEIATIGDK